MGNKLFQWCRAFGYKPTETDKAAMTWEMRAYIRKSLGMKEQDNWRAGNRLRVYWDAAVGQDQKWYVGKITKINGSTATIQWDGGIGVDDLNLNHLYVQAA